MIPGILSSANTSASNTVLTLDTYNDSGGITSFVGNPVSVGSETVAVNASAAQWRRRSNEGWTSLPIPAIGSNTIDGVFYYEVTVSSVTTRYLFIHYKLASSTSRTMYYASFVNSVSEITTGSWTSWTYTAPSSGLNLANFTYTPNATTHKFTSWFVGNSVCLSAPSIGGAFVSRTHVSGFQNVIVATTKNSGAGAIAERYVLSSATSAISIAATNSLDDLSTNSLGNASPIGTTVANQMILASSTGSTGVDYLIVIAGTTGTVNMYCPLSANVTSSGQWTGFSFGANSTNAIGLYKNGRLVATAASGTQVRGFYSTISNIVAAGAISLTNVLTLGGTGWCKTIGSGNETLTWHNGKTCVYVW